MGAQDFQLHLESPSHDKAAAATCLAPPLDQLQQCIAGVSPTPGASQLSFEMSR